MGLNMNNVQQHQACALEAAQPNSAGGHEDHHQFIIQTRRAALRSPSEGTITSLPNSPGMSTPPRQNSDYSIVLVSGLSTGLAGRQLKQGALLAWIGNGPAGLCKAHDHSQQLEKLW